MSSRNLFKITHFNRQFEKLAEPRPAMLNANDDCVFHDKVNNNLKVRFSFLFYFLWPKSTPWIKRSLFDCQEIIRDEISSKLFIPIKVRVSQVDTWRSLHVNNSNKIETRVIT